MARVKRGGKWITIPKGAEVTQVGRKSTGSSGGGMPAGPSESFRSSLVVGKYRYDPVSQLYYTKTSKGGIVGASSATNIQIEIEARKSGGGGDVARRVVLERQAATQAAALKLAQQKAQEAAKAKLLSAQAKIELNRITSLQQKIIRDRGLVTEKKSRDVRTGNILNITEYRKNGNKVRRVYDTVTGEIRFNAFAPDKSGGATRRIAGVVLSGKSTVRDRKLGEKIRFDPNKVNSNLKKQEAGFTTLDLGKRLTGLESISAYTKNEARILVKKLEAGQPMSAKDRAIVLGLQFAIPSQQLIIGAKQLPAFASSLVKNPKNIIKVPGQILTGLKESGLEIIALGKVDPALAIARIAGELLTFKAISGGIKVTGKVTGVAAKRITPTLKPIKGGAVIAKTATKNGFVKFRVVTKKAGSALTKRYKVARGVAKVAKKTKEVRKVTKAAQKTEIRKFKSSVQYSNELKIARRARKLARKKGRTINVGNRDFIEGVAFVEEVADKLAKSRAKQFLKRYKAKGNKFGVGQEEEFIRAVGNNVKKTLNDYPAFKRLKNYSKLTKPYQIKVMKTSKFISAKKLANKINLRFKKFPISKQINSIIKKIKKSSGIKDIKEARKGLKRLRKLGKEIKVKELRKFKSAVEYSKELKIARGARRLARKKGRTINVGNDDYIKAVDFIEDITDGIAKLSAKRFIKKFKSKGGKLGLGQEEKIIKAVQKNLRKELNGLIDFKKLKEAARLTKPFQIKIRKIGKISTAKNMFKKVKIRISKFPISKQINSIIKKIKKSSGIKDIKEARKGLKRLRKLGKGAKAKEIRRFKSAVEIRKEIKLSRKILRKAGKSKARRGRVKFKVIRQKNVKKVTLQKLKRSGSVSQANKFIDDFFSEVKKRRGIDIKELEIRQFKNILKKRLAKAINTGNKKGILEFELKINKMINDMNRVGNNPTVKVIEKGVRSRRIRTIKNFAPETPRGQFVEVKSGQQVLLQEVKVVQKARVVTKIAPQKVFVIQSVQKQSISLMPLVRFSVSSLSAQAVKTLSKQKTKQTVTTAQISKVMQKSGQAFAQDFKILQKIGQAMSPKLDVAQAVRQNIKSKLKSRQRLKTKQITKKKKVPVPIRRKKKPKNIRTLSKKVMTYAFIVRKSGKNVRLKIPPMILQDAWNVGAYRLDHDLQRTGTLLPIGLTNKVAVIPKNIKGYYARNKKKFRRFRVKKGKKFTLKRTIIENKKYIGDTRSERLALKRSRAKRRGGTRRKVTRPKSSGRKKVVKRKPVKRTKKKKKR